MAARKLRAAAPIALQGPHRQTQRQKFADILIRRDRLLSEVMLLRREGDSKLINNAQQLLTRWWSAANWNAREELLKTADWLIRLEKRHGVNAERPA